MALSKKAVSRLTRLADYVAEQDPANFDMGNWIAVKDKSKVFLEELLNNPHVTSEDIHACGTTACALGYAAASPYADDWDLMLRPGLWSAVRRKSNANIATSPFFIASEVFGITKQEAEQLFSNYTASAYPGAAKTPKEWAVRTRKWIADKIY